MKMMDISFHGKMKGPECSQIISPSRGSHFPICFKVTHTVPNSRPDSSCLMAKVMLKGFSNLLMDCTVAGTYIPLASCFHPEKHLVFLQNHILLLSASVP